MPRPSFDWKGIKKNRLTGLRMVQSNPSKWLFLCDCGNETTAFSKNVKKGHTQSCGCMKVEYTERRKQSDNRAEILCKYCKTTFKIYLSQTRPNEGVFCSRECKGLYFRKEPIEFTCVNCNTLFYKQPSRLKYDKNMYCSRVCMVAHRIGENHPRYIGGSIGRSGYKRVSVNGVTILEHRHVMGVHRGKALTPDEHVHHLDSNKLNNSIENLVIVSNSEHQRIYHPRDLTAMRLAKSSKY